jgi:aspartyl aminopeptidase
MQVIDLGVALLSMQDPFEMSSKVDARPLLVLAFRTFIPPTQDGHTNAVHPKEQ